MKSQHKQSLAFILLFVVTVGLLHFRSINQLPARTHAWAQSDHYALALGFLDNGFDFFHPQTFALSHQFPPHDKLSKPKGITAVDFPILHYLVAFLMKVLGTTAPWLFRFTSILISFIGLFVLFKTLAKHKGFWEALFVVGFIMFQPIYAYYQGGFHVSSAAFNIFLIGISQFFSFYHTDKKSHAFWGYFFLTLASLMRFIHIISLLAFLCMHLFMLIKTKKLKLNLLLNLTGFTIVISYFIYNKYLAYHYGSIFLGSAIIADNLKDFSEQLLKIGIAYARGFIPLTHLAALSFLVYLFLKNKIYTESRTSEWFIWLNFSFLGTLCFTFLMSWSLSNHDYYSLDTWMPVLIILLLFLIKHLEIPLSSMQKSVFVILFLAGTFSVAFELQSRKYDTTRIQEGADLVIHDFKESSQFLDNKISTDKKVLIVCGMGWNTPMVGWNREAYRVAWKFKDNIPMALKNNYDYIITHNETFQTEVLQAYPDFTKQLKKLDHNALLTIWVQKK